MISPVVLFVLRWIAPPVLGALAGYAIAAVAVRVVAGRPGSRGRRAISAAAGRAVAAWLTDERVRDLVRSPTVASELTTEVEAFSARLLASPVSKILSDDGSAAGAGDLLRGLAVSRAFIYAVRDLVSHAVESFFGMTIEAALSRGGLEAVLDRLLGGLAAGERRGDLARAAAAAFADNAGTLLDEGALDRAAILAEGFAPIAVERIVEWVRSSQTRATLSDRARELLPRILEQLNVVQRFLISAGQFDRRMAEKMPEIVDETVASFEQFLRDPRQQRGIVAALRDSVRDWRVSLSGAGREKGTADVAGVIESLLERLADAGARERVIALARGRLVSSYPTVGALARGAFGLTAADAVDRVSARILTLLTGGEGSGAARAALAPLLDTPLGELLGLDAARKRRLDAGLASRLQEALESRSGELVHGLDLPARISQAIDTVDARTLRKPSLWMQGLGAAIGLVAGCIGLFLRLVLPFL